MKTLCGIDPKHKRRSKNDAEGRMFRCQHCDKTYLSYPALYTHMKTKHSSPIEVFPMNAGRSRGRPKKVRLATSANTYS